MPNLLDLPLEILDQIAKSTLTFDHPVTPLGATVMSYTPKISPSLLQAARFFRERYTPWYLGNNAVIITESDDLTSPYTKIYSTPTKASMLGLLTLAHASMLRAVCIQINDEHFLIWVYLDNILGCLSEIAPNLKFLSIRSFDRGTVSHPTG